MATFATVDDWADFDSSAGNVLLRGDHPLDGYERDGSMWAQGQTGGLTYGRVDLTEEKSDLYVRGWFEAPRSTPRSKATGVQPEPYIIRGRDNGDSNTCFTLKPDWDTTHRAMTQLVLSVNSNALGYNYNLEHPMPSYGVFWVEFRITTGSSYGAVQAWVGGEEALAETRIAPNDQRTARYVDFGICGNCAASPYYDQVWFDKLVLGDEYAGPPALTKTEKETHTEFGRILTVYDVRGGPSGGWQDILPGVSDYVIEKLTITPPTPGRIEIRDGNENVVWYSNPDHEIVKSPPQVFEGRNHAVQHAREIRCNMTGDILRMQMRVRTKA